MLGPAILLYITSYLYIAFHFKNVSKTWKGNIAASIAVFHIAGICDKICRELKKEVLLLSSEDYREKE
jgi:hypothetical protein